MKPISVFATVLYLAGVGASHAATLTEAQLTAMTDALRDEIQNCWAIPADVEPRAIKIKFHLLKSGELDGKPQVVSSEPKADVLEASAVRAVKRCSPFASVAKYPEAYEDWREITVTFDPGEMF